MDGGSEFRPWDKLIPEALGKIFGNLSFEEVLTVIPSVCKSWDNVVRGPYCWQDFSIEGWSNRHLLPGNVETEGMLQMLINRSRGSLHRLLVSNLRDGAIFSSIADNAASLHTLRLRRCEVSDSTVEQIAGKLTSLTFLDLSYCEKIGSRALEAIGNNCKLLVALCRKMHPFNPLIGKPQDDEARAIAKAMPGIKHLEMVYYHICTESVVHILTSCQELQFLNINECSDVKLDDKYFAEKFPKVKVLGPQTEPGFIDFDWNESKYNKSGFLAHEVGNLYEDEIYNNWGAENILDEVQRMYLD